MKSGLQKDVLSLYRQFLKIARLQQFPNVRVSLKELVKKEFKVKAQEINERNIQAIEHELRIGRKKLEFFKEHPKIKKISFSF